MLLLILKYLVKKQFLETTIDRLETLTKDFVFYDTPYWSAHLLPHTWLALAAWNPSKFNNMFVCFKI